MRMHLIILFPILIECGLINKNNNYNSLCYSGYSGCLKCKDSYSCQTCSDGYYANFNLNYNIYTCISNASYENALTFIAKYVHRNICATYATSGTL